MTEKKPPSHYTSPEYGAWYTGYYAGLDLAADIAMARENRAIPSTGYHSKEIADAIRAEREKS